MTRDGRTVLRESHKLQVWVRFPVPLPKFAAISLALIAALSLSAQIVPAPQAVTIQLPAPTMLPRTFVSVGGGYASPGGSFAYVSLSTLVLPQGTYATVAQEYTIQGKQVQSCTFAGASKPLYQFWAFTIGLTGLAGGCSSTNGTTAPAGSGQGFLDIRWGKLPASSLITVMKNNTGGWKATAGFSWGQYR